MIRMIRIPHLGTGNGNRSFSRSNHERLIAVTIALSDPFVAGPFVMLSS
jgi:hypothetical protein